jgi:Methyltransferase domain
MTNLDTPAVGRCRNCDSSNIRELGFVGSVAPFFLKRVFRMELGTLTARNPLKILLRQLLKPGKLVFDRLYPSSAMVELQICLECTFMQMKHVLPEERLTGHYADYRSDSYNKERIHYEPSYAYTAQHIGLAQEAEIRVADLTTWLDGKFEVTPNFTMLDYGGADGRFLPEAAAEKYVFEISDYPPAPGVIRVNSKAALKQYSYVQVSHVLEHVMYPLTLVKSISELVEPGGYLYLEVPQEISDEELARLKLRGAARSYFIHEHVNQYSSPGIAALFEGVGFDLISIERRVVDYGYTSWTVVQALGRNKR